MRAKAAVMMLFALAAAVMPMNSAAAQAGCEFADEAIVFGGIAPLSAPGATVAGVVIEWAVRQAAADINAECGIEIDGQNHRLEVVIGDSEGISERAQVVVERLILEKNARAIVGMYHSAVALATMGVMQEHQIPTLIAGPWNDNITASGIIEYAGKAPRSEAGTDYIFRISPSTSMVARIVVDWLIALEVKDVVLIAENTDYGQPAAADERLLLEAAGVAVEQFDVELGTEDFVPILSRILARPQPPDVIHILVTGETAFNLNQQMAEYGIAPSPDTICIAAFVAGQSEQFWKTVPDGNYCAFNRVGITPSQFNALAADLNVKYEREFGDIAPTFVMEPYDAVRLMADAMERANSYRDGQAVAAALEATDVEFSQGHYFFAYGSHNPQLPPGTPAYMWHQWTEPIISMMQYFEPGQSALDAAVIFPPAMQTHGTAYIEPGSAP